MSASFPLFYSSTALQASTFASDGLVGCRVTLHLQMLLNIALIVRLISSCNVY